MTVIKLLSRSELELRLETALDELRELSRVLSVAEAKVEELEQALDELEKRMYD